MTPPETQDRSTLLHDHLRQSDVGSLQVAALLIVTLVPVFWVLDLVVLPHHRWTTLALRAATSLYGLILLVASTRVRAWITRHVHLLAFTLTLPVAWSIAAMCWLHEGYESSYYAGINLLIIGVGFLFVWPPQLSIIFAGMVYGFYMAPLVLGIIPVKHAATALSNQFFLLATMVIIIAAQRHRYRLEAREFYGNLDLQQTKASLEQAYHHLQQVDRLKSQFFSNITHELRTPLTMILSPLDGLLEGQMGGLDPVQKNYFEPIRRNALKLLKLINNLLDVAKIEEGYLRLRVERTDLRDLLHEVVEHAVPLAARKGLEMNLELRSVRDDLYVDTDQLERVIVNLVSNALKFTDRGGRVTVWMDARSDEVQIGVTDNGIGIPADKLDQIFERFSQADGSITRRYGGTGIGLALAKEIAELHGARISVQSERGKGATFILHLLPGQDHLPAELLERRRRKSVTGRVQRSEDREPREWLQELLQRPEFRFLDLDQATERRLAKRGDDWAKPTKVVVVEDNVEVLRFLHLQLQEEHAVYLAQDGQQGLELVRNERPDVIITDYMMPQMDGLAMLRKLRQDERTADIPAIMLTAKGDVDDRSSAREAGADVYLTKPFSPRELRAAVRQLLETRGRQASVVMREHVKSLEVISAGLAHEIHNPLSYIKNAIFVISEKADVVLEAISRAAAPDADQLRKLERAEKQIKRMREVAQRGIERIDQIVELVRRYAREGYPEDASPLSLDAAVHDVGRLVTPNANDDVTVHVDLRAGDATVNCIAEEMHQVIRNLWQNALEAVQPAGRVSVTTHRDEDVAVLEVSDDGCGIPADQLRRIFTPFFTTKAPGKGMGLGLALTHQVVDKIGGLIRVQSKPGEGTTFHVRLPIASNQSEANAESLVAHDNEADPTQSAPETNAPAAQL